jgi:putative holliday junction resolvase
MGRIMAFDYGQKRVGIAVTDPEKIIATALTVVPSHTIFTFIESYLKSEKVELFVVGYAKKLNNTDSESMQYIIPFRKGLNHRFSEIPTEMFDERFTSKIAFQAMIDGGLRKKDRMNKETVDSLSAVILLQDYLEYMKNSRQ